MLNRRLLRVKAMQAIYAQQQCARSNVQLAEEKIGEDFLPDLNSMEYQDKDRLAEQKGVAVGYFNEFRDTGVRSFVNEPSDKIRQSVIDAVNYSRQQSTKDRERLRNNMVKETESIYDRYVSVLNLIKKVLDFANKEKDTKREHSFTDTKTVLIAEKLNSNQALTELLEDDSIKGALERQGDVWENSQVITWVGALKEDEKFNEMLTMPTGVSLEEDKEYLLTLVREVVFSNEIINSSLEDADSNWDENKGVVRTLTCKTIKMIGENDLLTDLLMDLSPNWDEDRSFFINLYNWTLEDDLELENYIFDKIKNWDKERVASVDKIILKMAITEMKRFPSIPVKVTINEYLEIGKKYSTPQSRKFINGILDRAAQDLASDGKIKKSGKGLIDNK